MNKCIPDYIPPPAAVDWLRYVYRQCKIHKARATQPHTAEVKIAAIFDRVTSPAPAPRCHCDEDEDW